MVNLNQLGNRRTAILPVILAVVALIMDWLTGFFTAMVYLKYHTIREKTRKVLQREKNYLKYQKKYL